MVVITHNNFSEIQRLNLLFPFWIKMAVPIFMILSSYVMTISLNKKTISDYYSVKNLLKKYLRFAIPYSMILFVEIYIYIYIYKIRI